MEKESKHIAIMSIEEWEQFLKRALDNQTSDTAKLTSSVEDPVLRSIIGSTAALTFAKTIETVRKELFPDAEYYENEKGEMKWR